MSLIWIHMLSYNRLLNKCSSYKNNFYDSITCNHKKQSMWGIFFISLPCNTVKVVVLTPLLLCYNTVDKLLVGVAQRLEHQQTFV